MWAEGLTPTAASRLWGAPSRRTLAAWEKEALGGGLAVEAPRVPGACRRAKHARYPEETRAEALRLLGLGKPTREIARALGLPSGSVVSRWAAEARRRAKMAPEAIAMGKEKGAPGPREAELDRLRMECAVLREMLSDPKAGDPARLSNKGDVPGQREGGGLLRHAQAGVPLRPGVGGRRARGVRGAAVGVHGVVRRAPAQEVPRGGPRALRDPGRAQEEARVPGPAVRRAAGAVE